MRYAHLGREFSDGETRFVVGALLAMAVIGFGLGCVVGAFTLGFWATIPLTIGMTTLLGGSGYAIAMLIVFVNRYCQGPPRRSP